MLILNKVWICYCLFDEILGKKKQKKQKKKILCEKKNKKKNSKPIRSIIKMSELAWEY